MTVTTYNIQYGLGKDERYDLARIAGKIQDADVIALQEVERRERQAGASARIDHEARGSDRLRARLRRSDQQRCRQELPGVVEDGRLFGLPTIVKTACRFSPLFELDECRFGFFGERCQTSAHLRVIGVAMAHLHAQMKQGGARTARDLKRVDPNRNVAPQRPGAGITFTSPGLPVLEPKRETEIGEAGSATRIIGFEMPACGSIGPPPQRAGASPIAIDVGEMRLLLQAFPGEIGTSPPGSACRVQLAAFGIRCRDRRL